MVSGFIPATAHITVSVFLLVSPQYTKGIDASHWTCERPWNWYALARWCAIRQHRGHSLIHLICLSIPLICLWYKRSGSNPVLTLVHFARPCCPILPPHSPFQLKSQLLLSFSGNMLQRFPRTSQRIDTHHYCAYIWKAFIINEGDRDLTERLLP